MAEAVCSRHFRSFDASCLRCGEARYMNEAAKKAAHDKARIEAEFASMSLVPKDDAAQGALCGNDAETDAEKPKEKPLKSTAYNRAKGMERPTPD